MKKNLVVRLLLLLSFSWGLSASAAVIKEVRIEGNKSVSLQKITLHLKSRSQAEFSEEIIREDIKRLGETGWFAEVSYTTKEDPDGVVIVITVRETPVLEKITFKGNRSFKDKDLLKFLGVGEGLMWDEQKVRAGVDEIKEKYKEKGLLFADVTTFSEIKDDKVYLTVNIEEGRKTCVGKIVIEGLNVYPASKLRSLMGIKERRMPIFRGTFKQEVFDQDLEKIANFYHDNGYVDMKVAGTSVIPEGKLLTVTIRVEEGLQYTLGTISFKGTLLTDDATLRKRLVLVKPGSIFNEDLARENIVQLKRHYFDQGRIRASVEALPETGATARTLNLTYFIEPGEIYTVDQVIVRGNEKTKDKVIRREVRLLPGDLFTGSKLTKSFNNLRDLNYFDNVNLYPEPTVEKDKADLIVDVKEREKTGMFMFGGGYSSVDSLVGFVSVEQPNFDIKNFPAFTGGGQDAKAWFQIGSVNRGFNLSFTEPWFLDRPIWLGPDFFLFTREWDDYTEKHIGGDIRIGRRWDDFSLGFTLKTEEVKLSNMLIPSLVYQEGSKRKNSLTAVFDYHRLDSMRVPTKGGRSTVSLEYAGGPFFGDLNFLKAVFEGHLYHPYKKTVLHSKTYLGVIEKMGSTEYIPVYERFFGGGIGTVRGYKERNLGPKDPTTSSALGGDVIFAQNFEVLYPIYRDILKGVVFFDIGNVWAGWGGISDMKKGAGAGVRIVVPFVSAPIQIDYGFALNPDPGESRGRVHFGMSFGF